jgi:hypothetical protein
VVPQAHTDQKLGVHSIWISVLLCIASACISFSLPLYLSVCLSHPVSLPHAACRRTRTCRWDTDLVEEISSAIAAEARLVGIDLAFAPVINMWVDARFGRLQEGYSENPTLTAAYATAAVRGFQVSAGV